MTSVVCNETFDRRGLVGFGYASCCDKMNHASLESQSDTQAMKMDLNKKSISKQRKVRTSSFGSRKSKT